MPKLTLKTFRKFLALRLQKGGLVRSVRHAQVGTEKRDVDLGWRKLIAVGNREITFLDNGRPSDMPWEPLQAWSFTETSATKHWTDRKGQRADPAITYYTDEPPARKEAA